MRLCERFYSPYDDDISGERISASGPDVVVGATAVTSLALALHESATNAVKYGALSEPNGAIRIKWEAQGDDFRLDWEETGACRGTQRSSIADKETPPTVIEGAGRWTE